jgi:hypothetical protein
MIRGVLLGIGIAILGILLASSGDNGGVAVFMIIAGVGIAIYAAARNRSQRYPDISKD